MPYLQFTRYSWKIEIPSRNSLHKHYLEVILCVLARTDFVALVAFDWHRHLKRIVIADSQLLIENKQSGKSCPAISIANYCHKHAKGGFQDKSLRYNERRMNPWAIMHRVCSLDFKALSLILP